jgi:hypothetical protein
MVSGVNPSLNLRETFSIDVVRGGRRGGKTPKTPTNFLVTVGYGPNNS